jgi:hypothetical protein
MGSNHATTLLAAAVLACGPVAAAAEVNEHLAPLVVRFKE